MSQETTQKTPTATHESVSRAYAAALEASEKGEDGCCSVVCCTAGYEDEATGRFADAAGSSFGCGNPVGLSDIGPGQTVLDLGSGAGLDLLLAAERVGPEGYVIGVDMTDEMIAAARRNVARAGVQNVEVRKGIIEDLPVEDASVDRVISNCVINLSPRKNEVFGEIARVLKPGGSISVSDIVVGELPAWLRGSEIAWAACVAGAITEADYLDGLRAAGLEDVRITDRLVYEPSQVKGIVETDLAAAGLPLDALEGRWEELAGLVQSVRVVATRPVGPEL